MERIELPSTNAPMIWVRAGERKAVHDLQPLILYAVKYTLFRMSWQSRCIQMNFKTATDALFERISHEELAAQIGVSIPAIRQARLEVSAKAHRPAPRGWEKAVVELAENRIRQYHELIGTLEQNDRSGSERPK
jgi:hypothetical protein